MTQAQFAEAVGIDRDTLGRIERNEVEPRFSTIIKIAEYLRIHPSELVDQE
jgi:DNA-binding XRE family transcriptional regulator